MGTTDFSFVTKDLSDVELDETEPITIGKSGKASYCGDKSLDFSYSDEIKAYIATGFDKDEEIIWLTRVKDVPAGTPVLIKGEANKTYDVPVTARTPIIRICSRVIQAESQFRSMRLMVIS